MSVCSLARYLSEPFTERGRVRSGENFMENGRERHAWRGVVAGIGAGLAASWVMNRFMAGPGQTLQDSLKSDQEKLEEHLQQMEQGNQDTEPKQDATMKAADALVASATGGQHLSFEQQEAAGPMVHYGFGALVGGLYGALAEYSSTVRLGMGTGFGAALFAGADLMAVPAFHLGPPASETEPKALANPLARIWSTEQRPSCCGRYFGRCSERRLQELAAAKKIFRNCYV